MSIIEIRGLTKDYNGTQVVDGINFSVGDAETLVLLGPSGCGKTTTLKMINRLVTPTAGSVLLDGEDVAQVAPHELRKRMGFVIQNIGLFPHYTIRENIGLVPGLLKWSPKRTADRIHELMDMMGLDTDLLDRFPSELSGGQQQRIGVARALAADPPVVLLDEPFGALDPLTRERIRKEFKQLESLINKTMVMVTHDVPEAVELGDRICLLDRGHVQQVGTPRELIFKPANPYVKSFFRNQRLQLEMQVLTLKDLIPYFESYAESGSQVLIQHQGISVWDLLNEVDSPSTIRIVGDHDQVVKDIDSDQIVPAFQKYRNHIF